MIGLVKLLIAVEKFLLTTRGPGGLGGPMAGKNNVIWEKPNWQHGK
jgi:hypothetical protein